MPDTQPQTDIDRLLRQRRTIKPEQYSAKPVPDALVWRMLANAHWAPTHGYTEPWCFKVFSGAGRRRLAEFQGELYDRLTPTEKQRPQKREKLLQRTLQASHVVLIGMVRHDQTAIPEVEEIEAVACAVQNMMLTAAAEGVGSYWSSGGFTYSEEMKAYLGLQPKDQMLGYLYLGYPAGAWPQGRRASDYTTKVQWIAE
jgi:nitroreductase